MVRRLPRFTTPQLIALAFVVNTIGLLRASSAIRQSCFNTIERISHGFEARSVILSDESRYKYDSYSFDHARYSVLTTAVS